jgi:ABC-type uncharacterized transport system ATPase subunit
MSEYIVEMRHITKRFPGIIANNDGSISHLEATLHRGIIML